MTEPWAEVLPAPGMAFVLRARNGEDPLPGLLRALDARGVHAQRDVVIGMPGDDTALTAELGDFWFHSDGAFLPTPPRWVVLQLVEADEGGALHVLDLRSLLPLFPRGDAWFGRDGQGVALPVVQEANGVPLVRYRRDFMRPVSGGADVERIHALIEEHAGTDGRNVGSLAPLDCLLLDNWCMLHRREAFRGRRVVRRLWLGTE